MKLLEVDLRLCDRTDHGMCTICANVDALHCARGRHCSGLRLDGRSAPIGYFMDADDRGTSAYTFQFEGNDEFLFCEDCAIDIEETLAGGKVTDPILEGTVGDLTWSIDMADGAFQAFIMAFGPDHGPIMEQERGVFDRLTDAVVASRDYAAALVQDHDVDESRAEFELDNDEVMAQLRRFGRLKHPTDLAVHTSLTARQLDHVLRPGGHGDPPVTIRDELVDRCREFVGQMIAEMAVADLIPEV